MWNVTHSAYDRAPYRNRGTLLQPAIPTGQTGKQACGCMVHHLGGAILEEQLIVEQTRERDSQ